MSLKLTSPRCHLTATMSQTRKRRKPFFTETQVLVAQGDAQAQFATAKMYWEGNGIHKDLLRAAEYFMLAMEQGHTLATAYLAGMYHTGEGVPRDMKKATKLFDLVEAGRDPDGWFYAGNLLLKVSSEKNQRAVSFLELATDAGHPEAPTMLAERLWTNSHRDQSDASKAMELFEVAAARGDSVAQFNLGHIFLSGEFGRQVDPEKVLTCSFHNPSQ